VEKNQSKFVEALFLVYFLVLPFVYLTEILDPFLLARQLFTNAFLLIILLYIIFIKKNVHFAFTAATYIFLGMILIGVISFSQAIIPSNSHFILSKYLTFFVYFTIVTKVLYSGIISLQKLKTYLFYFAILSLTIAILALLNKTINGQNLFRQVDMISGTFANKNLLSSVLFCTLPFYFLGFSLSRKTKIAAFTGVILTIFVLLILRTRTALIATVIFLFLVLFYELKNRVTNKRNFRKVVLVITITVLLCCASLYLIKNNPESFSDINIQYFNRLLDTKTLDSRTLFWENSFEMIGDNFWLGTGLGNWIVDFPAYGLNNFTDYGIVNGTMIVTNPHNDFLLVFCEIGFIGVLLYIAFFATMIFQLIILLKKSELTSVKKMYFYLLSFILGYLIIACFDFPLDRIEHQILLLTVFAIVNSTYLKLKNRSISRNKLPLIFVVLLLLYSTTVVLYRIDAEKHVFKMLEAKRINNWQNVILESNLAENYFYTIDSKSIPLEWYKATALFRLNHIEESNKIFLRAHKVNPNNITTINDLASSYTALNKQEKAIYFYKKALKISINYENARLNLAAAYFNKKEYENAFLIIEKCTIHSKNENYKVFLAPIVEIKLNSILEKLKNPKLNSYLQQSIKNTDDLIELYFISKNNNVAFEKYIEHLHDSQ